MDTFEWKPGFSLVKYGSVYTLNCNQEFAQRFSNVMRDCGDPAMARLAEDLKYCMDSVGDIVDPDSNNNEFMLSKYSHVYLLTCKKEFMQQLNAAVQNFLLTNRVSPAVFSFSQQLDGFLLNKYNPKNADNY